MRSLAEIVEDLKTNGKPDYEELRYAVLVYGAIFNLEHRNYTELLSSEKILPKKLRDTKADSSFKMYKTALNTPPKEFLGWNNDPENPEYQKFHAMGNKLVEKLAEKQEANETPKDCVGHFMTDICVKNGGHHGCPHYDGDEEVRCFYETSMKGPCECEFKGYCHIPRQQCQAMFRREIEGYTKEKCDFYKMFRKEID